MIDRLKGILIRKEITSISLDIGNIAFTISVPLSTFEKLGVVGESATLYTFLNVREDALDLFGFHTSAERDIYIQLLRISGVGPKMGLAILSRFSPTELRQVVFDRDVKRLTTVAGIGKKTAERLLIDLKDRLSVPDSGGEMSAGSPASEGTEAIRALEVLGFTTIQADNAIRSAAAKLGENATIEELVKLALKGG